MVSPAGMTLAVPVAHDGYRVVIEPTDDRVRVVFNGETIADSPRTLLMHETRLSSVYYFPLAGRRAESTSAVPVLRNFVHNERRAVYAK